MALHTLFPETELAIDDKRVVKIDGKKILVFRLEDGFYAIQNACTHMFAPLSKGKVVEKCRIQCPFHRAEFDIRTGQVEKWANFPPGIQMLNAIRSEKALETYQVTVAGGQVQVEID